VRVAHHATSIEEHDERVVAIEQNVDLLNNILNISAEYVSKGHGSALSRRNLRPLRRVHE
jgi:hypothetical protein